jgi:hypothetical protein
MRKMAVGLMALGLLIVLAAVILHILMPNGMVASPRPTVAQQIDASMLQPGMNCKICVVSSESSSATAFHGYCGIVTQVNPNEIVLDDAVYQEDLDSKTRVDVGKVRIPMAEIAVIQHWGRPGSDDGDGLERIGVTFR